MKIHYTYRITNLINGMFYIGKHSTEKIDDGYLGSGKALRMAIGEFGEDNFRKEILGFYNSEEDVLIAERAAIEPHLENVACYNLAPGGGGHLSGRDHPSFGKRWKQGHESREKAKDRNAKPVYQFMKDGTLIEMHVSCTKAAHSLGYISHSNIAYAARNNAAAYGFLWSYNARSPKKKPHGSGKRITQFSKDGSIIKTFDSVSDAIREYGAGVRNNLLGKNKTAYGFIWRYEEKKIT